MKITKANQVFSVVTMHYRLCSMENFRNNSILKKERQDKPAIADEFVIDK